VKPLLTLYYDGLCPICVAEMTRLRRWNTAGRLAFVDISMPGFDPASLRVDMAALDREMHAVQRSSGRLLVGIDAILASYTLVERGWMVAPLRVKMLRPGLAAAYRVFARNRYRISRWLGYGTAAVCEDGRCTAHRRGNWSHGKPRGGP
jgi:predicted DCC family thiol-disulfide oxidoreductase YuxK